MSRERKQTTRIRKRLIAPPGIAPLALKLHSSPFAAYSYSDATADLHNDMPCPVTGGCHRFTTPGYDPVLRPRFTTQFYN